MKRWAAVLSVIIASFVFLTSCIQPFGDQQLLANTQAQLVDWHISGFWIVNSPVAWVRVINLNPVPIKDVVVQYNTYDATGHPLDQGTYTFEETIQPGCTKNYIEIYLGLVNLYTERLSVKVISASRA